MILTPSPILRDLHGSAGNLTVRRHRGQWVVEPRRRDADASPLLTPTATVIVDNTDPGFSVQVGTWTTGTSYPEYYGPDYRETSTPSYQHTVLYDAPIPFPATYATYIWYPQAPSMWYSIELDVYHDDGFDRFSLVQNITYGRWVHLGTFAFSPGHAQTYLRNHLDFAGIADAMMWQTPPED